MTSYPVAYRSGATGRGFQDGPRVAFLDTSKIGVREPIVGADAPDAAGMPGAGLTAAGIVGIVNEFLRPGLTPVEADPPMPDRAWPEEVNEDWIGADWPDRGNFEDEDADEALDPFTSTPGWIVAPHYGFTKIGSCTPPFFCCSTEWKYFNGPPGAFACGAVWTGTPVPNSKTIGKYILAADKNDFLVACPHACNVTRARMIGLWGRTAGYQGYAYPQGAVFPNAVEPKTGTITEEVPYYDDAWDLPVRQPGQVNNPAWPAPGRRVTVAPGVRPGPMTFPGFPFPMPGSPGTGVIVTVGPNGETETETQTQTQAEPGGARLGPSRFPSPPNAGTREGKARGASAVFARAILNMVTEFGDFVDALWKALDKKDRKKCKKDGRRVRCSTFDKIMQLGDALYDGKIDAAFWKEAFIQVVTNEIVDRFYGTAGKAYAKASEKVFPDKRGFQTGGSQRRGLGGGSVSDTVEGVVRRGVERAMEGWGY